MEKFRNDKTKIEQLELKEEQVTFLLNVFLTNRDFNNFINLLT